MDQFQQAFAIKAADDSQWGPRDARGRRRVLTAEELDDLADFGWPWDGVKGRLAACTRAVLSCVRLPTSTRIAPTRLPLTDATAQV